MGYVSHISPDRREQSPLTVSSYFSSVYMLYTLNKDMAHGYLRALTLQFSGGVALL